MDPKAGLHPVDRKLKREKNRLSEAKDDKPTSQWIHALSLWGIFFAVTILLNGTVQFALGADMSAWVYSPTAFFLVGLLVYGILFTVTPIILIKGWQIARQPAFWIPLVFAVISFALFNVFRGIALIGLLALAYLHWRYDLSELGFRTKGWKGDLVAIISLGLLSILPNLLDSLAFSSPAHSLLAALDRMFANPASTVENMFYFGFLTERFAQKTGKWLTPFLIGAMYTAHEMTNPQYWYEGKAFPMIFITVTVVSFFYLWRRSVVVVWLGDGLSRFTRALLG